jgi:hypothetical protein
MTASPTLGDWIVNSSDVRRPQWVRWVQRCGRPRDAGISSGAAPGPHAGWRLGRPPSSPHMAGRTVPRHVRERESPRSALSQVRGFVVLVGDTGFEPVTSSVSRKRATAAPIARVLICGGTAGRWVRDLNPCTRICSPLPRLSANPPWRHSPKEVFGWERPLRADDEARTRDLNLGKVALYQLSYVRLRSDPVSRSACVRTVADAPGRAKSTPCRRVAGLCGAGRAA